MKQARWLTEFRCLSEYTRLYPILFEKTVDLDQLASNAAICFLLYLNAYNCNAVEQQNKGWRGV